MVGTSTTTFNNNNGLLGSSIGGPVGGVTSFMKKTAVVETHKIDTINEIHNESVMYPDFGD